MNKLLIIASLLLMMSGLHAKDHIVDKLNAINYKSLSSSDQTLFLEALRDLKVRKKYKMFDICYSGFGLKIDVRSEEYYKFTTLEMPIKDSDNLILYTLRGTHNSNEVESHYAHLSAIIAAAQSSKTMFIGINMKKPIAARRV